MQIEAVIGTPTSQDLPYQNNYMEFIYGQDCGDYEITFTPDISNILILETSGNSISPHGTPFIDKLNLVSNSVDDIGIYNVKMNIGQDVNDSSQGFDLPFRGTVETSSYDFVVIVNPCTITNVVRSSSVEDIEITVNDPEYISGPYQFDQQPACGYQVDLVVLDMPSFMTHDPAFSEFKVQTSDANDVGIYTVRVRYTIQVPTDATKTDFT